MPFSFRLANVVPTGRMTFESPGGVLKKGAQRGNDTPIEIASFPYNWTDEGAERARAGGQLFQSARHGFVDAVITAYNEHHALRLRPDDVWLAILGQFAVYVDRNAEKLRSRLVDFEGKRELTIYDSGTLRSAPYGVMSERMVALVAQHIRDPSIVPWALPSFSTSTVVDRAVGSFMLMSGFQQYFNFKFCLKCGIPEITLDGEVADWESVRTRAQRLIEFDLPEDSLMTKWSVILLPVLDELVQTAAGRPNLHWWARMVNHLGGGSGPTYISGWITAFCLFNDAGNWTGLFSLRKFHQQLRQRQQADAVIDSENWPVVDIQSVPSGLTKVPVLVDDNGVEYRTMFYAGHPGFTVASSHNREVAPTVGWCMTLADTGAPAS